MTAPDPQSPLDAKLDRLLRAAEQIEQLAERQRAISDFIGELSPVLTAMMDTGTERLADLEARGYFRFGRQALRTLDRVVGAYTEEELARFGDHAVIILDTIRNLTQPDVLHLANEATDAIHQAGDAKPVGGVWDIYKRSKDPDVQRGLAVLFEVLRQVGKAAEKARDSGEPVPTRRVVAALPAPAASFSRAQPARSQRAPADEEPEEHDAGGMYDAQGFLRDATTWTRDLALAVAGQEQVALTDEHWAVIDWARGEFAETGTSPNVRRLSTGSGNDARTLYRLFPRAPARTIAKIAGLPKPGGCI